MFEESCHKVVTTGAKNRADAAAKCEAMGAKLASITSQQEIQFFMTQSSANGYSGPFLIGLNDRMFEGGCRTWHGVLVTGLILGFRPAKERRCYFVTTSLIGWAQAIWRWVYSASRISYKADSRFAPSQLETSLFCNDVFHWQGASLESALS